MELGFGEYGFTPGFSFSINAGRNFFTMDPESLLYIKGIAKAGSWVLGGEEISSSLWILLPP